MKKKLAVLLLGFALFTGVVSAFELEVETVNDRATTGEPAEFKVHVENTASDERRFELNVRDYPRSRWYEYERRTTIEPHSTEHFNLTVRPSDNALQDNYAAEFSITELQTDDRKIDGISYRVVRERDLNIEAYSLNQTEVSPGETVEASVTVRNVGASTLEDKTFTFKALNTSKSVELNPITAGGLRTVTEEFKINNYESPGLKEVVLEVEGRQYIERFNVSEVDNIQESSEIDNRIFVVYEELIFENLGNIEKTYSYEREVPSYVAPVFYAPGAEENDSESGKTYRWEFELAPGESETVSMRTDYWIPVTGLIILLAGFLGLKRLTSSVKVLKRVESADGKINVTIEVENDSSKVFKDVVLEEFVPNVLDVDTSFDMANPEVKHSGDGSSLKWWINDLEPGDQRIFKYSVTPKVEVEEGITIRPSVLKEGEKELASSQEIEAEFNL